MNGLHELDSIASTLQRCSQGGETVFDSSHRRNIVRFSSLMRDAVSESSLLSQKHPAK
jgi:hypothetical protein